MKMGEFKEYPKCVYKNGDATTVTPDYKVVANAEEADIAKKNGYWFEGATGLDSEDKQYTELLALAELGGLTVDKRWSLTTLKAKVEAL
jgi:hypothetical protein